MYHGASSAAAKAAQEAQLAAAPPMQEPKFILLHPPERPADSTLTEYERGVNDGEKNSLTWLRRSQQYEEENKNLKALVRHLQVEVALEMWERKRDKEGLVSVPMLSQIQPLTQIRASETAA